MNQGIYGGGRVYYLRNPDMSDEEIARHLTVEHHVVARSVFLDVPDGTFWTGSQNRYDKLIAVRGRDGEIVLFTKYVGGYGRAMLSIADFPTSD